MAILGELVALAAYSFFQTVLGAISLVFGPFLYVIERLKAARNAPKRPYKSVFITGGSSGLGEGLAVHYSAPGVTIAITGRSKERLEAVAAKCRAKGAEVFAKVVDVTDQKGLHAFIDEVDQRAPIDLVVANAGIAGLGSTEDPKYTLLQGVTDITSSNLQGVWNTIFPLTERMCARKRGQVALMSSLSGFFPTLPAFEYSAAKANLTSAGRSLRRYCEPFGVSVVVIAPGFVRTAILTKAEKYINELTVEEAVAYIDDGLKRNVPVVSFPTLTYLYAAIVGIMHPIIYDSIGRLHTRTAGIISRRFFDKKNK